MLLLGLARRRLPGFDFAQGAGHARLLQITMPLMRTLLALLVVASVALLPLTAGGMASANPSSAPAAAAGPVMPGDCEHDSAPCPQHDAIGSCTAMAGCSLKCFDIAGEVLPGDSLSDPMPTGGPMLASRRFAPQPDFPPFRPPRL
ncbi:MAG: hypothetical protein M5U07_15250 [Xanthobacteraceae bacterium]|nr:hypothetical protein [Xanthobacteraceae bacterium]GIK80607.1 MAG: hypothetical protein BroJett024_17120 [Alphaproteobacteria bacterium]